VFEIEGTGAALPQREMSASKLEALHELKPGQLSKTPAVQTRYYADKEDQIDLAVEAALQALLDAGTCLEDVDLVISASAIGYQPLPSTAARIAGQLGFEDGKVETFDINTSCLSFLTALDICGSLLWSGRNERALIVSSEIASRGLPWHRAPETAALFGDGAAAAVVSAGPGHLAASLFRTYPSGWDICQIASGGTRIDPDAHPAAFEEGRFFEMQGKDLYRITAKYLPGFVEDLLAQAGWNISDIDCVIPHQASPLAIAHMTRALGLKPEQVVDICSTQGNQIAASIPSALHHARKTSRIGSGDHVLLLGTSAGFSLGGMALEIE
jgi:3-oxoacyl-[acyl-carrier-protein] synthase III